MMDAMTTLTLNNCVELPAIVFGVFQIAAGETREAVRTALDCGYRLIDTAAAYGNEREVGEAVRDSHVERSGSSWKRRSGSATMGMPRRWPASRRARASSAPTGSTC